MTPLAEELNTSLQNTVIGRCLSERGRHLFFPKGIVAQSAEASKKARRFNATMGMAYTHHRPILTNTLHRIIPSLPANQIVAYAPTAGIPELRNTWKELQKEKNPSLQDKHYSLPVVTGGITHALATMADLFLDPDDVVIVPDMFWGNYRLMFEQRYGARIRTYPFFSDQGTLNTSGLAQTLTEVRNKAIMVLNFPNNPTGYSPTREEAERIIHIIEEQANKGTDIIVITDDAYFGLFYEPDIFPQSLFAPLADRHPNILAIKADGVTKEDYAWGLRVGFLSLSSQGLEETHYQALEKKIMGAIRSNVSNLSNLSQYLMLQLFRDPQYASEKQEIHQNLESRYRKVRELLQEHTHSSLKALPFNSGYFMTFQCHSLSAERLRQALLQQEIGTISIQDQFLRVAFASIDHEDLAAIYEAIFQTAKDLCE